jgi:hypothetical protein
MAPQDLPRPRAGEEVSAFSQGINALRDRAMFLLMLRCGRRMIRYLTIAGIPKVYPPRSLRQPFAIQLLNAGASLEGDADTEREMRTRRRSICG